MLPEPIIHGCIVPATRDSQLCVPVSVCLFSVCVCEYSVCACVCVFCVHVLCLVCALHAYVSCKTAFCLLRVFFLCLFIRDNAFSIMLSHILHCPVEFQLPWGSASYSCIVVVQLSTTLCIVSQLWCSLKRSSVSNSNWVVSDAYLLKYLTRCGFKE